MEKVNKAKVLSVINEIKWRKAVGSNRLPVEVWKVLGEIELSD